jgi:Large polyvalent protein associated domain 38/ADP-Ribosyltransferase in polyvalent proteins
MPYQIKLPDGSLVWIADNVPQSKAMELAKASYPDAFPAPPGIGSQLLSAPKEFIKGAASGLVQAAGGLGALPYAGARYFMPELKPFEQTGFGQAITGAERYLAPSDEGVVTQLAGGLGSFASILGPQVALRGLGTAGRFAGMAPRAAMPVAVAQTAGLGVEEARQRVEIARGDNITVTPGQELASLSVGVPIGLTELLPVEKLFRGLDKTLSGAVKLDIANYIKRGLAQGGIEGAQEAASGLLQDLSAKGIYNPNLEVGQSMLGDAALGGGVGFIAQTGLDFLLRKDIGRAYQAKLAQDRQTQLNTELERMQQQKDAQIADTKQKLGVPDSNVLALPAPAPKVEKQEARDPLMNPVGFFNAGELTPAYLKAVNDIRKTEGKRGISQFSIEDLADAGAPQAELDRLLTYKTGYNGKTKLSSEDVLNLAVKKNVDTSTVGFMDFLRRATGSEDLTTMSQPQLFSAFKALDGLQASEQTQILPPGTNATRFSDDQYNKSLKNLTTMFPKNNMMSRDKAVQEIKDYSGLESDRDAESLLQTAIRNGDLTTTNRTVYELGIPGDQTSPAVRRYTTREAAERNAARLGLEVRERTHQDVALPGTAAQLPGGPDIRQGTFKQGVAPAGYEIRSPDAVLQVAPTQEEADAKADRLQQLRAQKANGYLGDIAKKEAEMAKSQRKLESMEADGKADTLEYKKIAAGVAAQNKRLLNEINALKQKVQNYTAPLEIAPKGEKPVTRDGFTLFEQGQPVATFPSQQAAEEAALLRLPDETLETIVKLAPSQKGLMPKRLGKMAEAELRRRRGEQPAGFGVQFTGNRAAAEARLAEAGVFTPEFQKAADELAKKLRPLMERLGLGDLRLNILKAIKTADGQSADGYYAQRLIAIAMDAENPIRTLRHEGIHALKELGAFTPQQWKVLEDKAKSEWMGKYNIASRYANMNMSQQDMIEEAIADAFSDFDQTKAPPGMIGALFNKIKQFFTAFGNGMRGLGFQTAEDIFQTVETGGLKRIPEQARAAGIRPGGEAEPRYQLPRVMSTGKIVGAPPGMATEEDRTRLVEQMTNLLSHPYSLYDESKNWYEDSGAAIREITRGDPVLTERVVRLMALYSQANGVGGNTTATIASIAQMAAGEPTAFAGRFPNTTAQRIPALLAAPTMDTSVPGVDDKLMNFYRNLHDATYQVDTFKDASTIDRWMMRLFGYPHAEDSDAGGASSVSNTQYIYAKDLIDRISAANQQRTGEALNPRQVQAVLWTYVKNMTDYNSLTPEKQATFEPSIIDFSDYITRATANITWESRPSTKLPLIPGIHKATRGEQEAFNRAVREIFIDPDTGEDKIMALLGNQQLYSSQFSIGAYENLIAPNVITKLVLQKDDGDYLTDVANKYASIIGYVTKQDAVPWYRADPTAGGKAASKGYRVTATNVAADPAFEERLFKHLDKEIPGIGFTRVGDSFDFINFRDTESGKPYMMTDAKYIDKLQKALGSFDDGITFRVTPFRTESGWISNDWTENKNGESYLGRFSPTELADLRRDIEGWSASYDRIADQFGKEYGWSDPRKFSLRSSTEGDGISLGEKQPGAITVDAVHYGKSKVPVLSGRMYGTGIRGAEAKRLEYAEPRIKRRVYFYIPRENGVMPIPEAGLGGHVYIQRFNNVLGPGPEMSRISREAFGDSNNFESGVIDAGYDGYAVPSMGMMVILNNDVPVEYRGTRDEIRQKPVEETVQIGDRRYALRQTNTPEFKKWFGKSTIVDDDGKPMVMYHGLAKDTADFTRKTARGAPIFLTDDSKFAEGFAKDSYESVARNPQQYLSQEQIDAGVRRAIAAIRKDWGRDSLGLEMIESLKTGNLKDATPEAQEYIQKEFIGLLPTGPHIMPLYVRAERPFDYENKDHVKALVEKLNQDHAGRRGDTYIREIMDGDWATIERPDFQRAIKGLNFDSFYVKEAGRKNIAVYEPNQVKSAVGNIGTFARDNNDIRYALALKGLQPDSALVPNEGGNPDGNLGVMPEKLGGKPIRMLIGTHSDTVDDMTSAKMYRPVSYGANHILNRVLNDPKRIPGGAEELLEKIVRTAQNTAQNYNSIYKEGNRFILYDGKNSLILTPDKDEMSIITMYTQENPQRRYGNPVWSGRAPLVAQFLQPVRGREVIAEAGRVVGKPIAVKTKRVYTPEQIRPVETQPVQTERARTTLTLPKNNFKYSLRDSLGQDTVDAIERTTTARAEKGYAQRMGEALSPTGFTKFRQAFINKLEAIERLSKDVAKTFGSNELLADTSAIAAALFSDRAAGVAASSYQNGVPVYKNGFTTVSNLDGNVKGLIPILEPLMKYNDPFVFQAFQFYAATRRGKRLTAEGREQLFTADDIRKGDLIGERYPEFKTVFDEYQKYNKGLVDFMKDTGVISAKEAEIWTQNWDYIPFYRQMEGEETVGPNVFSPIAGVAKPRRLKGGEAPLADFMETIVRNSRAAIEAGMKNVAGQRVVRDILRLNQGEFVPAALARGSDIVTIKDQGQTKHYRVDDPLLVEALKGLNLPQLPFLEVLAAPSNLLRNLVTKDPGFMLANLMRDSMQAWVTTGTNIIPIVDTFKQYGAALAGRSKEAQALANAGLFAGYDFASDVKSSAREVEAELRKRTGQRTPKEVAMWPLTKMWDALEKASGASDVATRAEVYKRTLAETGNEAEALYQAMEVLNFSRKGNSALIRVLTAVVPFMNARIQGLDVLYRSGFGKSATQNKERMQKAFITRGLTLMGLSWMYWMLASDTEEYETAEQEVRDNYWIIGNVRIPIPFEIGTVFKVFPERILEYFMGDDTGKDLKESVIRNITSTLAINPIPQAVLPIIENVANYSFFTGQPIVGKGLEDVVPKYQVSSSTSILAQEIGKATNYSPVKIDNLIRGYTGTLGTYAVMALDAVMRGEGDPPKATMKLEQMPVFKRFYASPESTGTITSYYEMKKAVDESVRTINFLERPGRFEELQSYMQDKGVKMQMVKPFIDSMEDEMTRLRDYRRMIQMSGMSPDDKRDALDNIRSAEVAMTRRMQTIKKAID